MYTGRTPKGYPKGTRRLARLLLPAFFSYQQVVFSMEITSSATVRYITFHCCVPVDCMERIVAVIWYLSSDVTHASRMLAINGSEFQGELYLLVEDTHIFI